MKKQRGHPVFNPTDFRAYLAGRGGVPAYEIAVPEDLIFTYDSSTFRAAISQTAATPADWYIYHDGLYQGKLGDGSLGIVHAMVGAPAAAMNLEELISYGAKRIYEVGLSGAIDTAYEPGDVVLLRGAFSDEGTTKHYFKSSPKFNSSRGLTARLAKSLQDEALEYVLGDAWTTDAPYRETAEKVASFRKKGAIVVNMESSAVFAIAKYRGVDAASAQIVSDVVSTAGWNPAFHNEILGTRRNEVLKAVLRAIRSEIPS